uniref:SAM domain-containing protein n=1 Tax=Cacopsylla melanoneura TaxID=428564 RepID=A0A8D8R195_9HEMI
MCDEVETLLVDWGFQSNVDIFKENQIDVETLKELDDGHLKDLIPVIAQRIRFKKKLTEWKEKEVASNTSSQFSLQEFVNLENRFNNSTPLPEYTTLLPSTSIQTPEYSSQNRSTEEYSQFPSITPEYSSQIPHVETSAYSAQISASTSTSGNSAQTPSTSTTGYSQNYHQNVNFSYTSPSHSALPTTSSYSVNLDQNFVKNILLQSVDGRVLLEKGNLIHEDRRLLAKLVIGSILNTNPNHQFEATYYTELANQIHAVLPNEDASLYFSERIPKVDDIEPKNPGGFLFQASRTRCRNLIISGARRARSRSSTNNSRNSTSTRGSSTRDSSTRDSTSLPASTSDEEVDDDIRQALESLSSRVDLHQIHSIQSEWDKTHKYRFQVILKDAKDGIDFYFEKYRILQHPTGYRFLEQDFNILHPNHESSFDNALFRNRDQIFILGSKLTSRYGELKTILKDIEKLGENAKDSVALYTLPYLLPTASTLKKKGSKQWKPSKTEIRDGLIFKVSSTPNLQSDILGRVKKLEELGCTLQPFVAFVGEIVDPKEVFVVVSTKYKYKVESISRAVDICFKIIQATNVEYQSESKDVWLVIQRGFYNIRTSFDYNFEKDYDYVNHNVKNLLHVLR